MHDVRVRVLHFIKMHWSGDSGTTAPLRAMWYIRVRARARVSVSVRVLVCVRVLVFLISQIASLVHGWRCDTFICTFQKENVYALSLSIILHGIMSINLFFHPTGILEVMGGAGDTAAAVSVCSIRSSHWRAGGLLFLST